MSSSERGGLKAAFTNFKKPDEEKAAELRLLGRTVEQDMATAPETPMPRPSSYQIATNELPATNEPGLLPRPLLQREPVRQLSFRCPVSITAELKRKAAFNQLEQQEILVEGLKRVLADLPAPPEGWQDQ